LVKEILVVKSRLRRKEKEQELGMARVGGKTEGSRVSVARYCLVKGILVIKLKLREQKERIRWPAFEENPALRSMKL